MMVSPAFLLVVSISLVSIGLAAAQCSKPPVVFNFGDSNSDTGGGSALYGEPLIYPDGRTYFHRPTGRLCDGRLVIDFLCESLHTRYLSPFFEPVERDFSNGVNFALFGSVVAKLEGSPMSLSVQILEFSNFHNRSIELRGRPGYKHDLLPLGEDDFKNALYTIDIGQNDLAAAFQQRRTYNRVINLIPFFISRIRDAMQAIYNLGGKNFWVHGTGPLGCLPAQLANRSRSSEALDKHGCVSDMNEAARHFNLELDRLCRQLRFEMENSTVVYVDVYSIKYDLIAASSSYGFEDPLMACPPYNINPSISCQGAGHNVCPDGLPPRISWDGLHYTEAANAIVASKILSANYSSPPLAFNFFCNIPS